ncbi:transcription factor MYB41-like [Olea europaea var. sylvestris]|uniref:transcription factor MYB41-like n=1 Tax=Olea europaea var. sylvestris TaxID=158386 RepID=UPI000C1D25F7|nr:transcription factor MYB41-like [Olea europaea var. sylvestris]
MAEWELVGLEVEARLSKNPSSGANFEGDAFLRVWISEAGKTFQNINASIALTSSLTKVDSGLGVKMNAEPCKNIGSAIMTGPQHVGIRAVIRKSYDFDDSSDEMLNILLDFSTTGNDLDFFED